MEPDAEDACKWLEGIMLSEQFNVMILAYVLQERVLLRTFMAFEGEIASAMSVSTFHMYSCFPPVNKL